MPQLPMDSRYLTFSIFIVTFNAPLLQGTESRQNVDQMYTPYVYTHLRKSLSHRMVRINLENTVQVVLFEQSEGGVRARGGGGGGAGRGRGGGVRGGALVGQLPRARDARAWEAHARRGRARLQLCILRRVNTRI